MTGKHIGILKSPEVFRKDVVLVLVLVLELEEVFSTRAKENLSKTGGDKKSGLQIFAKPIINKIDTRKELAKVRRCSGKMFYQYQF